MVGGNKRWIIFLLLVYYNNVINYLRKKCKYLTT